MMSVILKTLMATQWFKTLLVIGAGGMNVALLFLNREILTTGVYKFPYPIATTLIQCLITSFVVVGVAQLTRSCSGTPGQIPGPIPRAIVLADWAEEPPLKIGASSGFLEPDVKVRLAADATPSSPEFVPSSALAKCADSDRTGIAGFSWGARQVFPLAIVYLITLVLDNVLVSRTQLPTYVIFRIGIVPLSVVLSIFVDHISYSIFTIWSAFLACLGLFLASFHFKHQISVGTTFLGVTSSVFAASFPVLLLRTKQALGNTLTSQRQLVNEPRLESVDRVEAAQRQDALHIFWLTLGLTAVVSTILLIPVLLLSGELQDMYRNCYVLDIKPLWWLLAASGILSGMALMLTLLLCKVVAPVMTTIFLLPGSGLQLVILNSFNLMLNVWIDVAMCWLASVYLILGTGKEAMTKKSNWTHTTGTKESKAKKSSSTHKPCSALRNMIFPAVLYAYIHFMAYLSQGGRSIGHVKKPHLAQNRHGTGTEYDVGWLNRTQSSHSEYDGYLGIRPHIDAMANLSLLMEQCKEVANGKGVDDVVSCLSYLANSEREYLYLPGAGHGMRASEQDPRKAQFVNADSHGNTLSQYVPVLGAQATSASFIGICNGPVIPFHVYWTGSASWRVELFIKAYLYTQNLPCSRLWLWLDSDTDPGSVNRMLNDDPIFERFRSLIERGDVVLKGWKFPRRIPLPKRNSDADEEEDFDSRGSNKSGEKFVAPGIIQDGDGQQWLVLDPDRIAISPVAVSDAVRFIVLHLYGGMYCDMDVLLLRDMRPLLLPDPISGPRAFAEQWVERCSPADYNTAVISLPANSSLSSYLLRGGLRMGWNFHPRVIGRMMWRDGHNGQLGMLHNAFFDPLVTNLRREGTNICTVPCHKNFKSVFMSRVEEAPQEWSNYQGRSFPEAKKNGQDRNNGSEDTWTPLTNRSMENFFRGAWAYHIHNQWRTFPEPMSWMDAIMRAHDGFFDGERTNAYGEIWNGPMIRNYD